MTQDPADPQQQRTRGATPSAQQRRRGEVNWPYDRIEILADGIVHAAGIVLGVVGTIAIIIVALRTEGIEIAPIMVYAVGLIAMLGLSAAYNMWPISPTKWILRRFDHSAIYLLIAGTYTPFLAQLKASILSAGLGIGVWASAALGVALKLLLPGRFDRFAIVLCLLLGWSGVLAYEAFVAALPPASMWLLAIGGILYSLGTLFHIWERLRFHNAIWHGFVLVGASCHYSAVLTCVAAS